MGKYSQYVRPPSYYATRQLDKRVHPIWRGIGFLLMIILPIIAYYSTLALLERNAQYQWIEISRDLYVNAPDPLIGVKIGLTIVLVFIFYALFTTIGFILYRLFGSPRYGPLDVPPGEVSKKRGR